MELGPRTLRWVTNIRTLRYVRQVCCIYTLRYVIYICIYNIEVDAYCREWSGARIANSDGYALAGGKGRGVYASSFAHFNKLGYNFYCGTISMKLCRRCCVCFLVRL